MNDFIRLITLQDPNTRVVALGTALLCIAAAVIGSFAVLRRRALVGDAVSHAALPGVCLAYFVVGGRSLPAFLFGAFLASLLAVLCITIIRRVTRVKEDAAIGIILTSFFGLGVALSRIIQNQPEGNRAGLDTFIFGKAASMVRQDVMLIGGVAAISLAAVVLLYKEFKLLCFDREFASSIGRPALLLDLALMGLLCLCTVVGLPAVGAVLMVAVLIIPAAAARFWTESLGTMLIIAGIGGAFSGITGVAISALAPNLSTGPLVALAAGLFFVVSLIAAPRRGLLASLVRRRGLRRKILLQNLLRALYELNESAPDGGQSRLQPGSALALKRTWSRRQLAAAVALARSQGLVHVEADSVLLTPEGQSQAAAVVRAHRLWELYLISHADIAPDHVDHLADAIEHVVSPDQLAVLEARLRSEGRLPGESERSGADAIITSPHSIQPASSRGALE